MVHAGHEIETHEVVRLARTACRLFHPCEVVDRAVGADRRIGPPVVHQEPWPTMELARDMFGKSLPASPQPAPHYDFRTRHSGLWGKSGPYLYSKNEVSQELIRFVEQERSKFIVR